MEKLEKLQSIARNLLQLGCDEVVLTFDNTDSKREIYKELENCFDLSCKESNIYPRMLGGKGVEVQTEMIKLFGVTFHILYSL